ncbi:MAG: FtsX-like permease family protein [Candidatus Lokiarchaeota archaeon]|nr:FtsX-like permease family protein [Candidatus Lokiarchaeota archaeon]MBD3341122.1 FtsX-like permease family protein [Candidatus Lokiarchaeota archaeon]
MSLDFAIKDFIRKRKQTFPYVLTIALVVAFAIFLIYFMISIGLNLMTSQLLESNPNNNTELYFSGAINIVYSQFSTFILVLVLILTFIMVVVITTTLIISKKKDIAIMKALGTLPRKLYSYYLTEAYIIFNLGFVLGFLCGIASFGIFAGIMILFDFKIVFRFDFFFTPILFFSCLIGIFFISGYRLRKIGNQKIVKSFSKDIPHNYDASKGFTKIPRMLTTLGFNLKISIVNTIRRKGEFMRYLVIFTIIFLIIFSLGLGTFVLRSSSQEWIRKSQGENVVILGHEEVIEAYSDMYRMFSDSDISIDQDDINFLESSYLFNSTMLNGLNQIKEVDEIDERLISFCDVEEKDGYYRSPDSGGSGGYRIVGQQRDGTYPIIGVDPEDLIPEFEVEGEFFDDDDAYDNMTIGDGLAYNFFDYPLDQSLRLADSGKSFHISGVVIDSFYRGNAGYVGLNIFQREFNFTNGEINLILLELDSDCYDGIEDELKSLIKTNLGDSFTCECFNEIFEQNVEYLANLTIFPLFLILVMAIVSFISLYNYQKAGLLDKVKDFVIMKAIGAKRRSIKKILFFEALFVIIPSLMLCLGLGMLFNTLFFIDRVVLPELYVPFIGISIMFGVMLIFNYLSLIPIHKKIQTFSIKDFQIY